MRIVDLLRSYEGLERVVDETPEAVDVRRHVYTTDGVEYERVESASGAKIRRGTMVITALGPDRDVHGDPAAFEDVIRRLEPGARALVLFGWEPAELPYHRVLDTLTEHRCQVVQVTAIDAGSIHGAAVIERVEELQPPRNPLGEAVVPAADGAAEPLSIQLRMANEWAFGDFATRALRAALQDASTGVDRRKFEAYRIQAEADTAQRDKRINDLETKVTNLTSSTSLKVGQTLVGAARSPRALIRLPVDMVRIWRRRG
jgi:hypothetical protein